MAARNDTFDIIFSFATLHHIPSHEIRLDILKTVHGFLADGGRFIHSNWQFLNSPRLRRRVQKWSEIGLTESDVDENDYLLDWRSGGRGLRYVHHFSEEELAELAEAKQDLKLSKPSIRMAKKGIWQSIKPGPPDRIEHDMKENGEFFGSLISMNPTVIPFKIYLMLKEIY